MKKKILYLFSDTGGGHRSAAAALMKAVEEQKRNDPPVQEMVDVFAECSSFLNFFARLYGPVIKYSPKMWGLLYYWFNDTKKLRQMEKLAQPFIEKDLSRLISRRKPDVIVSVHPLLNHITVSAMKLAKHVVPLVTVVTDPVSLHRSWACKDSSLVIVATEEAKKQCEEYGVDPKRMRLLGLPIDPKFMRPAKDKKRLLSEMGLKYGLPTVLIMGGGEGSGNMDRLVRQLDREGLDLQMIVIAGRNKNLENKLLAMADRLASPVKIYGFTNEVPDIMSASDLIITKAGPGSIAEALAKELPLIITSWLPGQEEGNVKYVVQNGLGAVCTDYRKIGGVAREILDPRHFQKIKKNIKKINNPKAVYNIARAILEMAYTK